MVHTEKVRPIILEMNDIYKQYEEGKMVLDNIDFRLSEHEFCALVGPSGCGKSTLFRLIMRQERPTAGTYLLEGRPSYYPDPRVGIVYQNYALNYPHLRAIDSVALSRRLKRWPGVSLLHRQEDREEAMHYLEKVKLADHAHQWLHELSGGQQQRVAIAQALMAKHRILLMDEPFGALDPGTRADLQVFTLELWEEYDMTIIFVTHDIPEAVFLGTRVVVLSQHYTDDRGGGDGVHRGAKIIRDQVLPRYTTTKVKESAEYAQLVQEIEEDTKKPKQLKHIKDFNLRHRDSIRTLTTEEARPVV